MELRLRGNSGNSGSRQKLNGHASVPLGSSGVHLVLLPILDLQARNPPEFTSVMRDQNQTVHCGNGGNQKIIRADR
jgi:hypothetical protein